MHTTHTRAHTHTSAHTHTHSGIIGRKGGRCGAYESGNGGMVRVVTVMLRCNGDCITHLSKSLLQDLVFPSQALQLGLLYLKTRLGILGARGRKRRERRGGLRDKESRHKGVGYAKYIGVLHLPQVRPCPSRSSLVASEAPPLPPWPVQQQNTHL